MESIIKPLREVKKDINRIRRITRNERMYYGQLKRITALVKKMKKLDAVYVAHFKAYHYRIRLHMHGLKFELKSKQKVHPKPNLKRRVALLRYLQSLDLYMTQVESTNGIIKAAREMTGQHERLTQKFSKLKAAAEAEKYAEVLPNAQPTLTSEMLENLFVEEAQKAAEEDLLQKAIWKAVNETYYAYSLQDDNQ